MKNFFWLWIFGIFVWIFAASFFSCKKYPEMTISEIEEYRKNSSAAIFERTTFKPWDGSNFCAGNLGGTWFDTILSEPKTFNHYVAERDASSAGIIGCTTDALVDYDFVKKEWKARLAFFSVEIDEKNETLIVHYTLRPNLFWTYYDKSEKIPVTSDDVIFWYDEISGDKNLQSSGYSQQWVTMKNGELRHIDIKKIDEKSFDFIFPRIVADPLLATNMTFGPGFLYRKAKEEHGIEGVKKLFSIDCDPKTIPSVGEWYICEYESGQRIVMKRNPNFWEVDSEKNSIPYPTEQILQIIGDQNTSYLLFTQGKQEIYSIRPEELDSVVNSQKDYTVFRAEGSLSAPLWSFNQNPKNKNSNFYEWFCKKEFRQAMSCLLNRERIILQTYRGLAEPKYDFFPNANPFYNENISLKYRFDKKMAISLLKKIKIMHDDQGFLRDEFGRKIEFDLTIPSANSSLSDIAQIISDECAAIGIKINIRQTDFQKIIEMLTVTFDWQSVILGLGSLVFPSQGSNVWPSSGNLHLWHPSQQNPATSWEKKIDELYNEGCYTTNSDLAKKIWDEYQELILEECPIIYIVRPKTFCAIQNRWDLTNFFYDNINGAMTSHLFLKASLE